jgi:hypothetical protein
MIAFLMIMGGIFVEHFPEGVFPKQDEFGQGFFLDGSHPALGMGIQIRTTWGKVDEGAPSRLYGLLKGGAELGIAVIEHMLPGSQEASLRHR